MANRLKESTEMQDSDALSKRQQRKLELTLKRFEDFEPKPKKKRKTSEKGAKINSACDQFDSKTPDSSCKLDETENIEEAKEFPQNSTNTTKPVLQKSQFSASLPQPQLMVCHYNHNYKQDKGVQGLFQYLITYQMEQLNKKEEKEEAFRLGKIDLGLGKPLGAKTCPESAALFAKLSSVTAPRALGEKLYPFSKAHKAMTQTLRKFKD